MLTSYPLLFEVDIKKIKDGVVKFNLFATNIGEDKVDDWSFTFGSVLEIVRSRNASFSFENGVSVFEPAKSKSKLGIGAKKGLNFELDFGTDAVSEQDILDALTLTSASGGGRDLMSAPASGGIDDPVVETSTPPPPLPAPEDQAPPVVETVTSPPPAPEDPAPPVVEASPPPPPAPEDPAPPPAQTGSPLNGVELSVATTGVWDRSFNMEITIQNNSGEAIDGWSLAFAMPAELNKLWRGTVSTDPDGILTVTDAGWNSRIDAGASVYFGFNVDRSDPPIDPDTLEIAFAPLSLNGRALEPAANWEPVSPISDVTPPAETGAPVDDATPAPAFPDGIEATARIANSWNSGYVIEVSITNNGASPIEGWQIAFDQPGEMAEFWRADVSQGGDGTWLAKSLNWNGRIEPGGSEKFGFTMRSDGPVETLAEAGFAFSAHAIADGSLVPGDGSGGGAPPPQPGGNDGPPPADPANVIEVQAPISTAALQEILDTAPAGSVVELGKGTFRLTDTLVISRDDITLKGAGIGETVLMGLDGGSANGGLIRVNAEGSEDIGSIARDMQVGDRTLVLDRSHSVSVGDNLYIRQDSDPAFLNSIGSTAWRHDDSIRNTVAEVVAVNGREIVLRDAIGFDYDAGKAEVDLVDLAEHVTFSDFTVTYDLGNPNHHSFTNQLADRYYRSEAISLRGTADAELKNIESVNSASTAFHFRGAIDLTADNLIANGAHNKGGGGNGYAFELEDVHSSTFTNLTDLYMRHGFTMGSWFSSGNNTAHIAFTNRDVNFHGGRDFNNTVIVDRSVTDNQQSGQTHTPAIINVDGAPWGAPTDPTTNSIKFTHVVAAGAGRTDDLVHGTDEGAYIETRAGEDTLVGGQGNDTLVAGKHNDEMWGGAGRDTFVFAVEGGRWTDVIHDFQVGEDQFQLRGNLSVNGFTTADLGYGDRSVETRVALSDGSEVVLVDTAIQSIGDLF